MQRPKPWLLLAAALLAASPGAAEIPVSGRVEAEGKHPIAGAAVRLLAQRDAYRIGLDQLAGRAEPEPTAEARTDELGRFTLQAPATGLWLVHVAADGFVPMTHNLSPLLEETFLPTVTLRGGRQIEVTVLGPEGQALAGAMVKGHSKSPGLWFSPFGRRGGWSRAPRRATSDAEGGAILQLAEGERLEVHAGMPGLAPAETEQTTGEPVELRLRAGRPVTVTVLRSDDRPVAEALVQAGKGSWAAGLTGADGALEIALPEDGVVRATGMEGARGHVTVGDGTESVELVLDEPARLAGRVIDADSRQPVPGALVWSDPAVGGITRTDQGGRFQLAVAPRGGSAPLQAAAPGYFPNRLRVSEAQEFEPVLALSPAAVASGQVVNAAGEPVAGAELTARFVADSPGSFRRGEDAHTSSGEDGRFRFAALTPEIPLRLEGKAPGYAAATLDLEALEPRDARVGLRLVLDRGSSLSGRVIGLGEPLAGAELTALLQPQGSSPMVLLARMRQLSEEQATADEQGLFEYRNLRPGTYRLTVSAPGFASLLMPGIEVGAGGADVGSLELEPGVEITGVVVDGDDQPVQGAEVRANSQQSQLFGMGDRNDEPQAVSGPDGAFTVADRRAGERVDLAVTHEDYQPAGVPGVLAPNPQEVRIVLQLGARLSGTVVDPSGGPVADARVSVMVDEADFDPSGMGVRGFRFPVRASTDDTGRFELQQVPSGKIRLTAAARGWRTAELSALEVAPGAELDDLRLVLERGATVTGRVFAADGQPAAGAWVRVQEPRTGGRFTPPPRATTGGDGQYLLEGVETGLQLISARSEDDETTAQEIEVATGINRLDLRFAAASTVSGRVVDDTGAPLPGVTVMLITDARQWSGSESRSGAGGGFEIEGVRDGQYLLRATRDGYATLVRDEPVQVAGGPVTGLELVMTSGGAISGSLFGLEESQLPLVGVFARGGANQWSIGQARHDGSYTITDLPPGEWHVQAAVPEGPKAQGRVTLGAGQSEATLDLDFSSGVVLTGQVLRSGEAPSGLMVQVRGLDVAGWSGARTDHEGRFRIEGLEAGRHRLEVTDFQSGVQHREEIDITGDRDIVVELFTGRVAGRVLDADDLSPVAEARIALEPVEETTGAAGFRRWTGEAATDNQGRFVIPRVSAADYRLRVVRQGYAPAEQTITVVPEGDLADLELLLEPTSGLRLRVRGASGAPVPEIDYALLDDTGRSIDSGRRSADQNGLVRLPSAPPGSHDLLVKAPGTAVRRQRVEAPGRLVEVALEPACRLEVRVAALVEAGAATLRLTGADGVPFVNVRWGDVRQEWELYRGRQSVSGLPAGSFNVEVTTPDGRTWRRTVSLSPGATTRLDL